jgi:hypothetical protein
MAVLLQGNRFPRMFLAERRFSNIRSRFCVLWAENLFGVGLADQEYFPVNEVQGDGSAADNESI